MKTEFDDARPLTTEEAAVFLGIKPSTVRLWQAQGKLPYYKLGTGPNAAIRFSRAALQQVLQRCARPGSLTSE